MSLKAPRSQSSYTLAPKGAHVARLYQLINIGTNEEEYMGEIKDLNKVRLTFELPLETKVFKEGSEPKPVVISQDYTLSMGKKANLRRIVEGMIGTSLNDEEAYGFDVESLMGTACLLTIIHKTSKTGKERAEIASVSPLMKGQVAPPQVNPTKVLTYSNWDQEFFESLPEFLQEKMMTSQEYQAKFVSSLTSKEKDDIVKMKEELRQNQADFDQKVNKDSEIPF